MSDRDALRDALERSHKVRTAWSEAKRAHAGQMRKIGELDYFDHHVDEVAALVASHGGSDNEITAALLHDTVEDQGWSLTEIAEQYGAEVASMVDFVSERLKGDDLSYRVRKSDYIDRLYDGSTGALRVALADKLHNAESTLANMRDGIDAMSTFPSFFWYYDSMLAMFATHASEFDAGMTEMYDRLTDAVDAVRSFATAA